MGIMNLVASTVEERTSLDIFVCHDNIVEDTESFQISFTVMTQDDTDSVMFLRTSSQANVNIIDTSGM